ncbi:cytochrome c oxidase subunit 4 [Crossiella cryophila]|uniref:Cytochrome c oxidase polypeptide 4 n=1 Tax=Crossiella cryophila TaxID=43355 RepID=A0A7W7FSX9_9PSEU|nr:cytochrome c oxidase subunit 4 [Crossiella cryophila]MBB4676657.1 hypothetical protein [Crossiella cryophila]
MKVEARIFEFITAFCFVAAIVYGFWAREPVGTVGLVLSGGLTLLCGTYFRFIARRIDPRPEDEDDAEIADGAGELGFFSPGSYWPVGMAAAAAFTGVALAFFHIWLIALGLLAVLIMVGGLLFEYHTAAPSHD